MVYDDSFHSPSMMAMRCYTDVCNKHDAAGIELAVSNIDFEGCAAIR